MICTLFKSMLDVYLDGRLAGFQARRLERHVKSCPDCASELAAWKRLTSDLRSISVPPPPAKKLKVMLQTAIKYASERPSGDIDNLAFPLIWESTTALACGIMLFMLSFSGSFFGPGECSGGAVDSIFWQKK